MTDAGVIVIAAGDETAALTPLVAGASCPALRECDGEEADRLAATRSPSEAAAAAMMNSLRPVGTR
jgi:hypothetical protein